MPAFLFSAPEEHGTTARFSELRYKGTAIIWVHKRFPENDLDGQRRWFLMDYASRCTTNLDSIYNVLDRLEQTFGLKQVLTIQNIGRLLD